MFGITESVKTLIREGEVRKRVADGEGGHMPPANGRGVGGLAAEPRLKVTTHPWPLATSPCTSSRVSASSVGPSVKSAVCVACFNWGGKLLQQRRQESSGSRKDNRLGGPPPTIFVLFQLIASHAAIIKLTFLLKNISGVKSWKVLSLSSAEAGPSYENSLILFLLVFSHT